MEEHFKFSNSSVFFPAVFFLSGITLTVLLSLRPMPAVYYAAEFVLCSIIWGFVAFKYHITDKVLKNGNWTDIILSVILSIVFIPTHYSSLNYLIIKFENENAGSLASYEPYISAFLSYKTLIITTVLAFAAISLCFIFICLSKYFRSAVIDFFRGLEKYEKVYLIAGSAVFAILIIILFNLTNVFYQPSRNGTNVLFNVIYTSDTGALLERNCYVNPAAPENDLRQPLFGIFAMPFGLVAKFISYIVPLANTYHVSINIIQIILLFISMVLLSRMFEVGKTSRIYFLLVSVATFPFMLFALNMEQYIFAVFWTVLLIYNSYNTRKVNGFLSVAATGSILTSVVLIPLLMVINKEFGMIIKKGWRLFVLFIAVFICGGMIDVIHKLKMSLNIYVSFIGLDNGFTGKFRQFTHFIYSCFIAPCSHAVSDGEKISYQICANNSYNITGMIILGLSVLSGFLFRRKFIAKISLCWIGFAFALICLLGWGTAENGTFLYSLYIFWAFAVLLVLLIDKFLSPIEHIKHLVFCLLILALMVYNIKYILDVINFGITYYPVL
jgi:hypothetical protein